MNSELKPNTLCRGYEKINILQFMTDPVIVGYLADVFESFVILYLLHGSL